MMQLEDKYTFTINKFLVFEKKGHKNPAIIFASYTLDKSLSVIKTLDDYLNH